MLYIDISPDMTDLSDVYGSDYADATSKSRLDQSINIIVNNLVNRQFKFRIHDTQDMWLPGSGVYDMKPDVIRLLVGRVNDRTGGKMTMSHIGKKTPSLNMLPELIVDAHVEYFMIIDPEYKRAYFLYITSNEVNAF
jgi:hypothetical protein